MLSRLLRIQPGDGRVVAFLVAMMFVSVAGMTIGESAASALFFEHVGPDSLPQIYLAQGVVGLLAMLVLTGVLGRFERRRTYVVLPLLLAGVIAIGRLAVAADAPGTYQALWLTTTIGSLVQGVYLWGTAGLVTDTRRAKRLFPLFGAGSILGAIAGGLGTRPLASAVGAENLLIVWALAFVGTSALCAVVLGVRRGSRARRARVRRRSAIGELREGFGFIRRSRLLVSMSIASGLFSVLFYSLYLPFAQAATARYADPDALAGFFGIFWATVTGGAFLVSILMTNRLLGWFGAAAMLMVLPVLYAGAFGVLLVTSTFTTLVAIRFGVNVWLQGVSSTSWEALVNVVPEHRRDQTRAFLNGGPAQVGTAIAGVVQLVGQEALTPTQSAAIGLAVAVITIVVAWHIRRSYTAALVDAIRAGRPRVFDDAIPNAPVAIRGDAQAVALAVDAMGDRDPRMRRLAGELLESADDVRAQQTLHVALADDDPVVRATALRGLGASSALGPGELTRAFADPDPLVRRAGIRAAAPDEVPTALLRDDDPSVAAAAAGRLLGGPRGAAAAETFERLLADEEVRLLALDALAEARAPKEIAELARGVLDDPSPAVHAAAVRALASASPEVAIPAVLEALTWPEPPVRDAARAALTRLGIAGHEADLARFVERWSTLAQSDAATAASIPQDGAAADLLRDALRSRARARGLIALSATVVTDDDPGATGLALDVLAEGTASQLANALETIEVAAPSTRPLLALWEPTSTRADSGLADGSAPMEAAATDGDPFIRACAQLVLSTRDQGEPMARSRGSMSPIELVLVLRGIPLFAALEPAELQSVARIAAERTYADGEVIGSEGDAGDEMHVVLDGTVRIVRGVDATIARRGPGDIVGEMSLITQAPRVATLIAEGNVRTLRIGHREFDGMVRERPEIALAVMRVLAERLSTASEPVPDPA